ncbi:hypothetical protein N7495_003895 [Penicillium taxi]|uniref:uncharacterized protein n=1 Tax=Penicillium taxi TaxID=168475 RepID=UPI002545945C|nr:uncharacterized protein N7495_003895 [Penicillium taxi]KAJ5899151.1 hypothetical protein N7495_003895 [Penicillium taxi]
MTSQRKSHVFRVTGLLRELPDKDLKTALQEALNDNFTDDEKSQIKNDISIVPSCYESSHQRMALVQFRGGVPQFLHELRVNPLGDWQIEMGENDINFDCNFFGFTQLYAPDGNEPVAIDIIAIAGLDGHAYGSWQGRGNLGRMWLRDFLSKDLPQCRTMIYGYNSKLSSHGVDTILDYGRELMEEIKKIRNTEELQQRPLVFIAHSFGGIILAHCLVRAIQTMDDDHPAIKSLHPATYGMILFAIPHKGLVMDDIQQMLAGDKSHPREQLLRQISSKSDLLTHQLADFKNLIRDRKVVSFYETEQTRRLVLDSESGRWKRTGDFMTTVGTDSALLQLPDHVEEKVPLHADHSMVVKFDTRNAAGYQTVLDRLRQFSQDAPSVVAARFMRPETPPPPLLTIPFRRDPDFVDRGTLVDQIQEKGATEGARIALVGLGGVGKSQLAIEYCYRVRDQSPTTWVFWIHASNATRFEQSCREIADRAKIQGRQDPKTNIFEVLNNWLNNPKTGKWVLVLDNLDDEEFLHTVPPEHSYGLEKDQKGVPRRSIWSYFHQSSVGCIVMTGRSIQVALRIVEDYDIILVEPMDKAHAISLFEKKAGAQHNREVTVQLVAALEFMPLAIVQAAAFIKQRAPRESVTQYLERFRNSDRQKMNLLDYEGGRLRRDPEAKNSILVTWQISFEDIQERRPSAAGLLSLMSFFDRQGIPDSLLREGKITTSHGGNLYTTDEESDTSELENTTSVSSDADQFEDDILMLRDYSLISDSSGKASFQMHRLVQLAMQKWLQDKENLEHWKEIYIRRLHNTFPEARFENWRECQMLFAHVQRAITQQPHAKPSLEEWASLLHEAASFSCTRGNFFDSKRMAKSAMNARKELFGGENIGGELKKAEKLQLQAMETCKQAMETYKQVFGPEHSNTMTIMANLASTYWNQGRWKEAEELELQVVESCKQMLGLEHPSTLSSMGNLASTYRKQGRWKEAEELELQAMESCKQVLGPEHPSTITSMGNLASTYRNQGRWKEAEELELQAIESYKQVLGPEHPNTLMSMANLASTYRNQGRWKEAEEFELQVMKTYNQVLGPEHPHTLSAMANLASTSTTSAPRFTETISVIIEYIINTELITTIYTDTIGYMMIEAARSSWDRDIFLTNYELDWFASGITRDLCGASFQYAVGFGTPTPTTWSGIPRSVSFEDAVTVDSTKSYSACHYTNTAAPDIGDGLELGCAYTNYEVVYCNNLIDTSIKPIIKCIDTKTSTSVSTSLLTTTETKTITVW